MRFQFEDGNWLLENPHFVPAIFLDQATLECPLPLDDSQVPAGPQRDTGTDTSRPLARWQIKVSCLLFSSPPHPLVISHMTCDRQHICCCADSRQPDVTVCFLLFMCQLCDPLGYLGSEPSLTKSQTTGVQRRAQLQQRQNPDPVRWNLSGLQLGL